MTNDTTAPNQVGHTPGPWELGFNDGSFVDIDGVGHGALARVVWRMDDDKTLDRNSPECEANARLIAAAPDLLEALKDTLELLGRHYPNPTRNGQISRGRAAIAKATGATP